MGRTGLVDAIASATGVVTATDIATPSPRVVAIARAAFAYVMDMGTSRGDGTELFYARCASVHAACVPGLAASDVASWDIHNANGFLQDVQFAHGQGLKVKSVGNSCCICL